VFRVDINNTDVEYNGKHEQLLYYAKYQEPCCLDPSKEFYTSGFQLNSIQDAMLPPTQDLLLNLDVSLYSSVSILVTFVSLYI